MRLVRLRKLYTEIREIFELPAQISKIPGIVKGDSYYPNKKRKSNTRIFLENLSWVAKNKEANNFYNYNGLDIKNWRSSDDFLPTRYFMKDRNVGNLCSKEEFSYNYLAVLRDKYLFSSYLSQVIGEDKVVPTIGLYSDSEVYLPSDKTSIILEDFFKKDRKIFCKVNNGECAKDVFVIESNDDNYYLNNKKITLSEIKLKIKNSRFIFQDIIQQHDVLNSINNSSVNTIRIITIRGVSGNIDIFSSFLRLGATEESFVDNLSVGGLAVGINDNGVLGKYGFYTASFGTKVEKHPISDTVFEGCQIPYWDEIKDLVKKAHKQFYYFQSVGWDVAITPTGPILIEGNDNWEIDGPQSVDGGLKGKWHRLKNS